MVEFPAPVGGTAYPMDFVPSVLFAVLYAILTPLILYRVFDRNPRTVLLLLVVTLFSIERIILFSSRASQAHNQSRRLSHGLAIYMQISLGIGYIVIASEIVHVLRCLLVNPTYGSNMYFQPPAAQTKGGVYSPPPPGTPDQPELRSWLRYMTGYFSLSFLAAAVSALIVTCDYSKDFRDQKVADRTAALRYVSAAATLALCPMAISMTVRSLKRFSMNSTRATGVVLGVSGLMATLAWRYVSANMRLWAVVAIYRLCIMHITTTSLAALSSLNRAGAKAAFYILHVLPEWLAITILLVSNIRKLCGTGSWGDFRWDDMTPKLVEEWEAKQSKKDTKDQPRGLGNSSE